MNQFGIDFAWGKFNASLQEHLPESDMAIWLEKFSLVDITGNKNIIIGYTDAEAWQYMTDNYTNEIYTAAYSVCGGLVNIKFKKVAEKAPKAPKKSKTTEEGDETAEGTECAQEKNKTEERGPRKIKKLKPWVNLLIAAVCAVLAVTILIVGVNFIENMSFTESFYSVNSTKVHDSLRIIQISDLHSSTYGKNNAELVKRVTVLEPDIIVMTGDCIDKKSDGKITLDLCEKLAQIAPTYYVYGNNENSMAFETEMSLKALDKTFGFTDENRNPSVLYSSDNGLRKKIEETGVKVLFNECDTIKVGTNTVDVYGTLTSNPSAFWSYAGVSYNEYISGNEKNFKLFLAHEPFIFEELGEEVYGDLALCGHTHGGQSKLPIIGSLYVPGWGLMPERNGHKVSGKTTLEGGATLIISKGLSNKGAVRINNQPQLVIIDVNRY